MSTPYSCDVSHLAGFVNFLAVAGKWKLLATSSHDIIMSLDFTQAELYAYGEHVCAPKLPLTGLACGNHDRQQLADRRHPLKQLKPHQTHEKLILR